MKKAILLVFFGIFCSSFLFSQVPETVQILEMKRIYNQIFKQPVSPASLTPEEKSDYADTVKYLSDKSLSEIQEQFSNIILMAGIFLDPSLRRLTYGELSQTQINESIRAFDLACQAIFEVLSKR